MSVKSEAVNMKILFKLNNIYNIRRSGEMKLPFQEKVRSFIEVGKKKKEFSGERGAFRCVLE